MASSFAEVSITADGALAEHLIGVLSQVGFEGFWEDGTCIRCYMATDRWTPAMLDEVHRLIHLVTSTSSSVKPTVRVETISDRNWNEEWEKTIKPIHVTERIIVTPTWHTVTPDTSRIILTIDPKMAFGTGYHETTRLSLRLIERHITVAPVVLDIGTGTGILAIAALKLGASRAVGVDNDSWAYDNARENAALNNVNAHMNVILGELDDVPQGRFDLIVANIQLNVLSPLLPTIKERLSPAGTVILSGLLTSDQESITLALNNNGFSIKDLLTENEWIALAAT